MWNLRIILLTIAFSWALRSVAGQAKKRRPILHNHDQDSGSECSFANFHKVISHNKFSLLLLAPNCRLYYIDGKRVKPSFEIDKLFSSGNADCGNYKAKFFRREVYKVLVSDSFERKMTTIDDPWIEVEPGVYSVVFDSKLHDRSSMCRPNEICIVQNVFTDAKEHFAYTTVYLKTRAALRMFLEFTLPDMKLSHSRNFSPAESKGEFKSAAYDSDMKVLYFYHDSSWFSQKVGDGAGTSKFLFSTTNKVVSHDPEFGDSSFSNNHYLAQKDSPVPTLTVGNSNQSGCVWRGNKGEQLSFELFVGTSNGDSVHDSIRRQIVRPMSASKGEETTTTTTSRSPKRRSSSANAFGSLPLTFLFLIGISFFSACFHPFS